MQGKEENSSSLRKRLKKNETLFIRLEYNKVENEK